MKKKTRSYSKKANTLSKKKRRGHLKKRRSKRNPSRTGKKSGGAGNRSVDRSPSPAPPRDRWRFDRMQPWAFQGEASHEMIGPIDKYESLELKKRSAERHLRQAEREYKEINKHIQDEKLNDFIKSINNTLSESLTYTTSIGDVASRIGTGVVERTGDVISRIGDTSFKYGFAPLVEKYSERRLKNTPIGTDDYKYYHALNQSAKRESAWTGR